MIEMDANDRNSRHIALFLDGEDVTSSSCWFRGPDQPGVEGPGTVKMFVRRKDGAIETVANDLGQLTPVTEDKQGLVRWERRQEPVA